MINKAKFILFLVFCMMFSTVAFAHSGRTDSSGGHHDYKNASGLGSYHYHHGYSAHLHTNGICPYDSKPISSSSNKNKTTQSAPQKPITQTTDINAYVNNYFIPSICYNNSLYVIAEDLSSYGYDVLWDSNSRSLKISKNTAKCITEISNVNPSTTYSIELSDIKTYLYDDILKSYKPLTSYNIGGQTIVKFSELGYTNWNSQTRSSFLS